MDRLAGAASAEFPGYLPASSLWGSRGDFRGARRRSRTYRSLYIRLIGGLSIVMELKMAGFRYSSPYAASGEDQIIHYMDNRQTHLGYLVVFDARLEMHGETALGHA